MRVLLVDDSKAVHSFIKSILPNDTFEFEDAFDGTEALEMIKDAVFDLILLDWEMPKMNGSQTLIELRSRGVESKIIMVTSLNDLTKITSALESGANEYVMKPFTKDILMEKIQSVMG